MLCRACGTELPADAKFCRSCGKAIAGPAAAPQSTIGNVLRKRPSVVARRSVVVNLGVALTVAAAGVLAYVMLVHQHNGHDDVTRAVPATAPAVDKSASSPLLNVRASDCRQGSAGGASVSFAPTTIPAGVNVDRTQLCAIASESAHRNEEEIRDQLESLCKIYAPLMRSVGTEDFAVAAQALQNSDTASEEATQQSILILKECANKDLAVRTAASGIGIRIYSVGSVKGPRTSCLGYLEEMTGMQGAGGSTSYFLYGTGECSQLTYHNKELVFHPEANPSGKPPGDVIHNLYAYTGPLPSEWTYKGVKYPFSGTGSLATNSSPAPDNTKASPENPVSAGPPPQISAANVTWREASLVALQTAAGNGEADAQTELALRFQQGNSVAKDDHQAVMWYRKAADQGSPRAATNLGWMYVLAQGVAKDDNAALALFKAAAARGYPNAEDSLGWMYQHGRGVPKDIPTAMDWYRKAAAQGFEKSKQNLALLKSKPG